MDGPLAARFIRSIDANRTIKDALTAAVGASRPRWRVSVTDLVNPAQSYYRWKRPDVRPSLDRLQVMMAGTGFHDIFGKVVSTEEFIEQTLELDGIVGKVDIYEDVPVELKTTSAIPADIYEGRNSYFEQLGMYCALAGNPEGRLLVYQRETEWRSSELVVYSAEFLDLDAVGDEMRRRRDLFKDALDREDPSGLPRCEWMKRGCDYSHVCDCRNAAPGSRLVPRDAVVIETRADIAAGLKERLSSARRTQNGLRLNDLVFPRKTALRRGQANDDEGVDARSRMAQMEQLGFRRALGSAMRYGSPGQFKIVPVSLGSISDRVQLYQDAPTILRAPKIRDMVDRSDLARFFSHYFDRIAFECALLDSRRGRVVLYYEAIPGDKFMVYDVIFSDVAGIRDEAERRLQSAGVGSAPHRAAPLSGVDGEVLQLRPRLRVRRPGGDVHAQVDLAPPGGAETPASERLL